MAGRIVLTVRIPNSRYNERKYIISVLLGDFLGLDYTLVGGSVEKTTITCNDDNSSALIIADVFFPIADKNWLSASSMPREPLQHCPLQEGLRLPTGSPSSVPVIYGLPVSEGSWFDFSDRQIEIGIDIFGSSFFMLTRYEELVADIRDAHERFPATASIAYREGFLNMPIVNVYLEVLWGLLRSLWPSLTRRPQAYSVHLSHDVDTPFCTVGRGGIQLIRSLGGDVAKRRGASVAFRRVGAYVSGNYSGDPCYTFDWIMDQGEARSLTSSFYFIAGDSGGDIPRYNIRDSQISELLRNIHERGHRIGLHPSYNSFKSPEVIRTEFHNLVEACKDLGIEQREWGGRQHYLRWSAKETWRHWEDAGLSYDSSLGYADHVGFRAGCCYSYRTYDLPSEKPLALIEKPLVVMEGSLLAPHHMGLSDESALERIGELARQCFVYQGEFEMLWHNDSLVGGKRRQLYLDSIQAAIAPSA